MVLAMLASGWRRLLIGMIVMALICLQAKPGAAQTLPRPTLNKEQQVLLTNVVGATLITAWGAFTWDYGDRELHFKSEDWFTRNTKHGGADKLGHFYSNYALTQLLAHRFEAWHYSKKNAARYAALSSLGLLSFMELGDGFSAFGFSYQDAVMNLVGDIVGYYAYLSPTLNRLIDFRVEYLPTWSKKDVFTDYEGLKYLMAIKMEGINTIQNPTMRLLELHLGFFARGYEASATGPRQRNVYLAVGINLSSILRKQSYPKTAHLFNYLQLPYSYLAKEKDLNR